MSDTETIHEIEISFSRSQEQYQQVIALLGEFRKALEASKVFDEEDVKCVDIEIDALTNNEVEKYRNLSFERLRILKQFDEQLNFKDNHPRMNKYFVQKQQEIMKVLNRAAT